VRARGGIVLRPAGPDDARRLLDWANDPATRAASFDREPISWSTHVAWLASVLGDAARRLWIAEEAGTPVGQVRVDRLAGGVGEVSIALAPGARGRGLGRDVLRLGVAAAADQLGIRRVRAVVLASNVPSLRLFEGAGFAPVGDAAVGGPSPALTLEADVAAVVRSAPDAGPLT
jgi:RimJ/RimL family protein N-acetyltransferase